MTVMLSLLPRSAASVASLFEHIDGSLTVSLMMDTTSSLLITSQSPSLAITCKGHMKVVSNLVLHHNLHLSITVYSGAYAFFSQIDVVNIFTGLMDL